jgi:hypothetical protein
MESSRGGRFNSSYNDSLKGRKINYPYPQGACSGCREKIGECLGKGGVGNFESLCNLKEQVVGEPPSKENI